MPFQKHVDVFHIAFTRKHVVSKGKNLTKNKMYKLKVYVNYDV